MSRVFCFVLLAIIACSAATVSVSAADKNRPVSKVITMMKDMISQLEKEGAEDQEVYETMGCWCETNDREKTLAISDAEKHSSALQTLIEDLTGNSARLNTDIAHLDQEIAKNEEALDSATSLRRKQLAEFNQEEKDMLQTITSLKGAVVALSKHHEASFLQSSEGDSAYVTTAVAIQHALSRHADILAGVITPHQKEVVADFVQTQQPQSGEIFGVLQAMHESFEQNLANAQKEETENNGAYEDLKKAKTAEISAGRSLSETKTQELATTDEKNANSKQDLEDTQNTLEHDVAFLADVKAKCQTMDSEYAERTKTRQLEIQAVNKALSFLNSDEAHDLFSRTLNFVQISSLSQKRMAVYNILEATAQKSADPRFSALATRTRIGAFAVVKKNLQDLIDNLVKEKEEEVEHRDFCIEELNNNERMTAAKNRDNDDLEAKVDDMKMTLSELTKAIDELKRQIAEAKVQFKRAGEDREKANSEFQVTVADQRATEKLLAGALRALKGFYGSALLQKDSKQPAFKSYEKNKKSGGVMGMIQNVIDDARALEAEAISAEEDAQKAYEDFVKDTNASLVAWNADLTNKSETRAKTEVEKVETETNRDEVVEELKQLASAASDLHADCDYALKNFELRQATRDEEIGAMKQGLAIFSGASFGAFLQNMR